jgi:hypothetical protein
MTRRSDFINEYWDKYNEARSDQDYGNLIDWAINYDSKKLFNKPIKEMIAQIWLNRPYLVEQYVDQYVSKFPFSLASLLMVEIRKELSREGTEVAGQYKYSILPDKFQSV